jgi:hypothetical protein
MEGFKPEKINNKESLEGDELEKYIETISEELIEKENIPLTSECRIDPNEYADVYNEDVISKDIEEVDKIKKRLAKEANMGIDTWEKKRKEAKGNKFEELKTVAYHKNSDSNLIVVRSSEYDDFINGVDNVMVDKKSGKVVCAIDEVVDDSGESNIYKNKVRNISEKNKAGGATIKYCFTYKEGEDKPRLDTARNVPIFHLSLSRGDLQKEISKFEDGDQEKELFEKLNKQISSQVRKGDFGSRVSEIDRDKWMV